MASFLILIFDDDSNPNNELALDIERDIQTEYYVFVASISIFDTPNKLKRETTTSKYE